jgi:multidrug resistance efflux pump
MKRGIVVLLLLVVVGGALAAGWWWARTAPEQATEFLVNAGLGSEAAQTLVASIAGGTDDAEEQALVASGSIEGEEVAIVAEFGGRIVHLNAREGDEVEAGEILVELDTQTLMAQMAQAEAAVAAAEANLASVKAGTHPAEILAAQAMLEQAIAERDAAERAWKDAQAILDNPQEIEAQIAQARAAVALAVVQAEQAQAQVASAKAERDRYRAQGSMEEKWLYRIHDYQVQAARVAVEAAQTDRAGAEATVAALEALRDNPLALASQVHMARGQYDLAVAGVAVAVAKLEELNAGPTAEEVAVVEAQIAQAEAAISGLQAQIDKMTLRSPMAGVVASRSAHAGEAALAGATLLTVSNLDEVTLTVYVPEDELGRVYLGQVVEVEVDSFAGHVFSGTVSYIAQEAEFTPKNVQTEKERVNMVFAVRVRLPNPEHWLKPGMPADAILRGNAR